jgi:hypothetical protein
MLRIGEDCQIIDGKIKIKVEKVTYNLETLFTPLEVKFRYSETVA